MILPNYKNRIQNLPLGSGPHIQHMADTITGKCFFLSMEPMTRKHSLVLEDITKYVHSI